MIENKIISYISGSTVLKYLFNLNFKNNDVDIYIDSLDYY